LSSHRTINQDSRGARTLCLGREE